METQEMLQHHREKREYEFKRGMEGGINRAAMANRVVENTRKIVEYELRLMQGMLDRLNGN